MTKLGMKGFHFIQNRNRRNRITKHSYIQMLCNIEKKMEIKKWTKIINWLGVLSAIWLIFFPFLYKVSITANIIIPLIGILYTYKNQGQIDIDSRKWDNTPTPKIDSAIMFPAFALSLRASIDIKKIIDIKLLIIYAVVISIPLLVLLFYAIKDFLTEKRFFVFLVFSFIFTSTYGIASTIYMNILLGNPKPEIYKTKIINKEVEKGKGTYYRIDYESWNDKNTINHMRVSKKEFENLKDSLEVELREGLFNIRWLKNK